MGEEFIAARGVLLGRLPPVAQEVLAPRRGDRFIRDVRTGDLVAVRNAPVGTMGELLTYLSAGEFQQGPMVVVRVDPEDAEARHWANADLATVPHRG